MTTELTGRALDEAAAVAMDVPRRDGIWMHLDGRDVRPPRFSREPELVIDMLSWLYACDGVCRPQYNLVRVSATAFGCGVALVRCCSDADDGTCDEERWDFANAEGATLNEALARLVVAVAAAKGAKWAPWTTT